MGSTAIISDVHSNLHALYAVLAHAHSRGIGRIICLGDVIGYGAHPEECVDIARTFAVCLRGNHEEGVLRNPSQFNAEAKTAALWTRRRLKAGPLSAHGSKDRWHFLRGLAKSHEEEDTLYVHGTPRNPVWEYLFENDCADLLGDISDKLAENFSLVKGLCFVGHTHIPGVIGGDGRFSAPAAAQGIFEFQPGARAIINVGSVGQPRDGNPQACYVIRNGCKVTFHRVDYDAQAAANDILATGRLAPTLGERLLNGA